MPTPTGKPAMNRRKFLKVFGSAITLAAVGYFLFNSKDFLSAQTRIRSLIDSVELSDIAASYGKDGDRVAYAVNYLNLPPITVHQVFDSWSSLSTQTKGLVGNSIPTATATIVADELTNPSTAYLAREFPNLLWAHAHSNAIFTFPWIKFVKDNDPRLIKMADLKFSEGNVSVDGQIVDLYYPEFENDSHTIFGKRKYIREGFAFFAKNFGPQLESMNPYDVAVITEQSIAAAVVIPDSGPYNGVQASSGDTFIFFNTADIPLYTFSAPDNSVAVPNLVEYGALAVGLNTMKRFRARHPNLENSSSLSLSEQGYVQIDNVFMNDPLFKQYLYKGFYEGAFCTNPDERTFAWKEYQTVRLIPERTVTGFDVASIGDFHPSYSQPLSMYEIATSIDELMIESPRVYTPSAWHTGNIFKKL